MLAPSDADTGMPEPFGGGGYVGRFLAGSEPQPQPNARRGRSDDPPPGRDWPHLSPSGGPYRQGRKRDGATVSPQASITDSYEPMRRAAESGRPTMDQYEAGCSALR